MKEAWNALKKLLRLGGSTFRRHNQQKKKIQANNRKSIWEEIFRIVLHLINHTYIGTKETPSHKIAILDFAI